MSDDATQQDQADAAPLPRIEELSQATGMQGKQLHDFLLTMVKKQFSPSSDDPLEVMMGGLTISGMISVIINDMYETGASQSIVDALENVQKACDDVVVAVEKAEQEVGSQEAQAETQATPEA